MEVRKSTKLFCLCAALLSLSAQGRFVVTETEIEEFHDETLGCMHDPIAVCPTRNGDGFFVLTQCIASEKNYFLWKMQKDGNVLRKTCLSEDEGRACSFPVDEIMMIAPGGHLLMVHKPVRYGQTEPESPVFYRFSLPNQEADDPNLLTLTIVGDPFAKSFCMLCRSKLSLLNSESCVTFARGEETERDVFLRLDSDGNVTQKIPLFGQWVQICDFDIPISGDMIAVIARKLNTGQTGRFWEYSAGFLDADEKRLLQTDIFQSNVYDERGHDKRFNLTAQELLPKMIALKDNSFLCFYSTPLDHESVAVRVRFYSPEFELNGEKELFRLDCGFYPKELSSMNTLDVAMLDDTHFVVSVHTKGRLYFWVFDLKGDLKYSKQPAEKQKIICVKGFFSLHQSVAAVVREAEIPSRPFTRESLAQRKGIIKLYTLHKK